ncbi:MAG: gliding motility-associated C-terminal domain-containing protein [Bacteroidota bacterium]|nr:gliding motility-associated C-terminal domain-containing protein [Bacteroidota bacterium]
MKIQLLKFALTLCFFGGIISGYSQTKPKQFNIPQKRVFYDSLQGFDEELASSTALKNGLLQTELPVFLRVQKREFINKKYNLKESLSEWPAYANKPIGNGGQPLILTAACSNEDFELGNISGWTGSQGSNSNSQTMGGCCPTAGANHSMVPSTAFDPLTNISLASPLGGAWAVRLGDLCTPGQVNRLSKTFTVTSANALFQIAYFAVFEDAASHPCNATPYVNISMLNCSGVQLSCPSVSVTAPSSGGSSGCSSTTSGWTSGNFLSFPTFTYVSSYSYSTPTYSTFTTYTAGGYWYYGYYGSYYYPPYTYTVGSGTPTYVTTTYTYNSSCYPPYSGSWSGWKTASLDLTPYIGTCVTIQLTAAGCAYGGHRGYAYFDTQCTPINLTVNNNVFPAGTVASTVSACGATTGTIVAPPGLGPYSWQGPAGSGINSNPSQTITTTTSGTYTLTMNPPGSCAPIVKAVTLIFATNPTSTFLSSNNCANYTFTNTGSAAPAVQSYSFIGSSAPPSFTTTSATTSLVSFPSAGNYTVVHVVTNTAGCTSTTQAVVNVPTAPNVNFSVPSATQCLNGNSFSFNAAVGTGVHSYSFNPVVGAPPVGGTSNYVGSFTAPGTYTVTHSVTNGGCTNFSTSVVVVNPMPSLTGSPINASCGNPNGSIIINNTSPAGQTAVSFSLNGVAIASQTATGLSAGIYTIGMTNNFGCKFTTTVNVANTPGITALATTTVNATCGNSNGSINIGLVTGGTATYSYNLNGGVYGTGTSYTGLAAGTYTVGVKDPNNCTFTKTVTINNTLPPTGLTFTTSPTACVGNTGILGITGVTGGVPAFSYSLNGVATTSITNSLAAGPKTITVKDANGCTYSTTANINTVSGPTAAVTATTSAACGNPNGSATVTSVSGGVPAYQYSFNGGAFGTSNNQGGLLAGPKNVVIKDVNGCTFTVNFVIGNTGSPVSSVATLSNVSCFGGNNGTFSISTSGGTPGYSYTLTPSNMLSGTGQFSGLTAQNYTVNVQDALGCVTTVTTSLSQPAALTLTLSSNQPSCFGGNNGTITATAGGGTTPYLYNLNAGANQASNIFTTSISAGAYNITVIDNKGCTLSQTVSVSQPPALALSMSSNSANCTFASGNASVTASGGTPGYTYSWTPNGGTGPQTTGVVAGSYTVLVTDTKSCTQTGVVTVGASISGTAVISSFTNVSCFGAANGAITANMIGGTAPLTYSWSAPVSSTLQTVGGLAPGTYSVQVTDFFGCKSSTVATITQPGLINSTLTATPATCFNSSTGSATTTIISGGTPGFTYLWTPGGATTSIASGLAAGLYSCQVTDANGCISTKTVSITQPSSVTINTSTITASCNQSNGSISSTVTGGTGPYTYTWSTGSNGTNLTGIPAGTYTVQVKDNNNCLYTLAATVPNAAGPSLSILSQTNVSCFGGSNGIAVAQVTGGTPGPGFPVYNWSNGQNTGTATNLNQGVYSATVTDAAGCIASVSVTITQPASLTVNVSGTNPKCFNSTNGTANAGVAGGTAPYTYAWLPAPGAGVTTATPSAMGSGTYIVTVTDSKGCIQSGSVALSNPPLMLASVSSTNLTCFNSANGFAAATTTNAVGTVNYYYTGGTLPLTAQNVSGLTAATYTMLATDQNSCTASVVFTVTQPPLLTVGITSTGSISCSGGNNGFATATPNGGTPGYNYLWSNGQTSATSSTLSAGAYTVTVTDSKGCSATANTTIIQPAGLTAIVTGTNVTCFGLNNGIGNVNYGGGVGIPSILWQPGLQVVQTPTNLTAPQIHTVTLTDANGCALTKTLNITQPTALTATVNNVVFTNCNQSNGSASVAVSGGAGGYTYQWTSNPLFTNNNITNVTAGAYTVTVTDLNGCQTSQIAAINNIAGPTINSLTSSSVICFGQSNGTASVSATGFGALTYLWSWLSQTVTAVTNLPNGIHSITVKDAANCITVGTVNIAQPTQVVSAIGGFTNVTCSGAGDGMAVVLANGGNPGYTYSWTPTGNISATLTNANPGTYTVLVKDVNNCSTTSTVTITTPNPLIITTNSVQNVNCNGGNNGLINTSITGGTPTYSITWTPTQPSNPLITNLAAGSYSLAVTDTKGCTTNSVYTINQPSALSVVSTNTTAATCGNSNGTANVVITGGTNPYNYSWNTPTPQLSNSASNLAPANWVLTTTDNKGCVIQTTVTVPAPALPSVIAAVTNPNCFGQSTGSATLTASGVGPFTYSWTPSGLTTAVISGIGATTYSAAITDANGCKTNTTVNVVQPSVLVLNQSPVQTICYGTNANVYGQGSGGTIPYSYTLTELGSGVSTTSTTSNGITSINTLTTTTQYTVAVTDANGCSTAPHTIIVNVNAPLTAIGTTLTACDNRKVTLTPNITSQGNGGPFTYNWSNTTSGPTTTVITNYNTNPNTYSVLISDGCTIPNAVAFFTVNVNPVPKFDFTPDSIKGCAPLTVNFQAVSTATNYNASNDTYFWSFGGDNSSYGNPVLMTYTTAGVYGIQVVATNSFGCTRKIISPYVVEVYGVPMAEFVPNPQSTTLFNPVISFTNQSMGATSYVWDFGDYASLNNTSGFTHPSHAYDAVGQYNIYLVAINAKGCKDTVMHTIEITPEMAIYIPNAFTPDDNNLNDTFQPKGFGINEDKYRMDIFDRWGELLFTTNTFKKGWDGRAKGGSEIVQDGVYIYKIYVVDLEGNKKNYVGHVTLIKQ